MSTNPYESPRVLSESFQPPQIGRPQLPATAIVFGILNLGMAALTLCGSAVSCLAFFMPTDPQALAMNPALRVMTENQLFRAFNMVAVGLGFISVFVLFVAGAGLITQKPFGRWLSIGYGWYAIVICLIGLLANGIFLFPELFNAIQNAPPGPAKAGAIGGIIGGAIGSVLGFVYPALLLFFMYRPNVIAAFAPGQKAY